jgi:hypothetical protein
MRFLSLLLVIGVVVLAVLNPGMDDFETFAAKHAKTELEQKMGDSRMGDVAEEAGGGIVERYASKLAKRKNYVLFSIYTIDLDGPEQNKQHWRFLGIADRFVELEHPPMLDE